MKIAKRASFSLDFSPHGNFFRLGIALKRSIGFVSRTPY
jgi:hypothetical protein